MSRTEPRRILTLLWIVFASAAGVVTCLPAGRYMSTPWWLITIMLGAVVGVAVAALMGQLGLRSRKLFGAVMAGVAYAVAILGSRGCRLTNRPSDGLRHATAQLLLSVAI